METMHCHNFKLHTPLHGKISGVYIFIVATVRDKYKERSVLREWGGQILGCAGDWLTHAAFQA